MNLAQIYNVVQYCPTCHYRRLTCWALVQQEIAHWVGCYAPWTAHTYVKKEYFFRAVPKDFPDLYKRTCIKLMQCSCKTQLNFIFLSYCSWNMRHVYCETKKRVNRKVFGPFFIKDVYKKTHKLGKMAFPCMYMNFFYSSVWQILNYSGFVLTLLIMW